MPDILRSKNIEKKSVEVKRRHFFRLLTDVDAVLRYKHLPKSICQIIDNFRIVLFDFKQMNMTKRFFTTVTKDAANLIQPKLRIRKER